MQGAEAARKLAAGRFEATIPDKLAELRQRYGADPSPTADLDQAGTLPAVALFGASERARLEADEWPALLVTRLRTPTLATLEPVDGGMVLYRVSYRLRAYLYVRGQEFDDVTDKVDRYVLAVREVLLANLGLAASPELGAFVDPNGVVEDYSGVELDDVGRTVGAAFIDFGLSLQELAAPTLIPGAPGDPQVATGTVTPLPPHPALD